MKYLLLIFILGKIFSFHSIYGQRFNINLIYENSLSDTAITLSAVDSQQYEMGKLDAKKFLRVNEWFWEGYCAGVVPILGWPFGIEMIIVPPEDLQYLANNDKRYIYFEPKQQLALKFKNDYYANGYLQGANIKKKKRIAAGFGAGVGVFIICVATFAWYWNAH